MANGKVSGYALNTSVRPGDTVQIALRATNPGGYRIDLVRKGATDTVVTSSSGTVTFGQSSVQPTTSLQGALSGCQWPVAYSRVVPSSWPQGIYFAQVTMDDGSQTSVPFVVKSSIAGAASKMLIAIAENTYQAYNLWGAPDSAGNDSGGYYGSQRRLQLSFQRPYDLVNPYYSRPTNVMPFGLYELRFLQWAEPAGYTFEYCTNRDVHNDGAAFLSNYNLFLSIGHDEYWSGQMRTAVDSFIAGGGNAGFFSGNTCFYRVRYTDGNMICYKEDQLDGNPLDPIRSEPDGPTNRWSLQRPANLMMGVGGAYGAQDNSKGPNANIAPSRLQGYTTQHPDHWVFAGLNLANGTVVGTGRDLSDAVIGYETDAAAYSIGSSGFAIPTGVDATPTDGTFTILGFDDCRSFNGRPGLATCGVLQRPRAGIVFTAATVNWVGGLSGLDQANITRITRNVLSKLSLRSV